MMQAVIDAMVTVVRDGRQRLVAVGVALSLVLAGAVRAMLEMSAGGIGAFPMPGDNMLMLALCLSACILCCVRHDHFSRFARTSVGRISIAGIAFVSVALLAACRLLPSQPAANLLFWAGASVRLSSLVCLLALCARVSALPFEGYEGPLSPGTLAAQMAWGTLGAVVLDLVFLLLAPVGVAVAGLLVPVAMWGVFRSLDKLGPLPVVVGGCVESGSKPRRLPVARLVTFALYGLVGGITSGQAHSLGTSAGDVAPTLVRACLVNDVGLVIGAAVLLAGVVMLGRRNVDPFALRYLLVPVYLVVIFLTPLMSSVLGVAIPVLMAASQVLFYGMLWVFPHAASASERVRWFAAGCGAFFGGTYLAMWFGGDLLPTMASGDIYMIVASVLLGALVAAELLPRMGAGRRDDAAARESRGENQLGHAAKGTAGVTAIASDGVRRAGAEAAESLADRAAEAWGLTPRERAVLPGLLRGRSVAWVADSLTVSKNTVHTHMRNIYQKAGVHSQEELIDAADDLLEG